MKLSLLLFFLIFSSAVFAQSTSEPAIRAAGGLATGNWQTSLSVSRADVGIRTRYYLLKTRNIAAFGQVGYGKGQTVARQYMFDKTDPAHPTLTRQENRSPAGLFAAGAGVQYLVGKRWSAEITLEQQAIGSRAQALPCSSRWHGSIGLTYRIGR